GVYRSTNSGSTWTLLTGAPSGSGIGRVALAVAPSASTAGSHVLYVVVVQQVSTGNGGVFEGLRSGKAGAGAPSVVNPSATPDFLGGGNGSGQGWYDVTIIVDPANSANVFAAGVLTYSLNARHVIRSINSGSSWADITVGSNGFQPHTDSHATAFTS